MGRFDDLLTDPTSNRGNFVTPVSNAVGSNWNFNAARDIAGRVGNTFDSVFGGLGDSIASNWSGANDAGPPKTSGIAIGGGSMPAINFGPSPSSAEYENNFAKSLGNIFSGGGPVQPDRVIDYNIGPGKITQADVGADVALKNRTMSNAMRGSEFNPMMIMLNNQRQQMIDRRNAAISAAGRGAGAPYNAAIARLNDEISKLQDQMPRVSGLFDQKIQNQYDIYDRAGSELETSYDDALSYASEVNEETAVAIRETFSDAQESAAGVVQNIGADEATALAVAEEVGRFEEIIIGMDEVNAQGINAIMQASENLAVKSAIAAGATNALDLKRKQIEVESDMKEKLQSMIEDRKQQTAARNAAVSAARAMAAARWPSNQPLDRGGFQNVSVQRYFGNAGVGGAAAEFGAGLIQAGMSSDEFRLVLNHTRNGVPKGKAVEILGKYGMDPEGWSEIPANVRSQFGKVATGMEIYYKSGAEYEAEFSNADPRDYEVGSAARAMAGSSYLTSQGHSAEDAFHFGREIAETDNDKLSWIDNYGTPSGGGMSGSTVEGTRQSSTIWRGPS